MPRFERCGLRKVQVWGQGFVLRCLDLELLYPPEAAHHLRGKGSGRGIRGGGG